jgi:hypothetical protein
MQTDLGIYSRHHGYQYLMTHIQAHHPNEHIYDAPFHEAYTDYR